jgi:hypothetical protein
MTTSRTSIAYRGDAPDVLAQKDPGERLDYRVDWADAMAAENESALTSSAWSVSDPAGLTIESASPHAPSIVGAEAVVWVSGGSDGVNYELVNTVVTAGTTPRTQVWSIVIPCRER